MKLCRSTSLDILRTSMCTGALLCLGLTGAENAHSARTEVQQAEKTRQLETEAIVNLPELARFWLTEDVADIISREERTVFLRLASDEERDQWIEQFWARRTADPKSLDNSFKRGHYERIASADTKYGTQIPGFQTDRGRIYVGFGPPDSIESRPREDGYARERWGYGHLDGVGENVEFEFVDRSGSGDYQLAIAPEKKDALFFAPHITMDACGRELLSGPAPSMIVCVGPMKPPALQFKDLEPLMVSRVNRGQAPFSHHIEFARATHATTLARIVIYLPAEKLTLPNNVATSPAGFEILGRISRPSGRVVETFERRISPGGQCSSARPEADCQFNVPVGPGKYRLAIAVKNVASGETSLLDAPIDVPSYEKLNAEK